MKVSWEYYSQYIWKNKKCSKPPTSLPSFTHVSWHRYNSPFTIHRRPTTPPRGPKRPLHDLRKEVHRTRGPGSGEGVHAAILEEIFDGQLLHWVSLAMINGNFRILKLELLYICTIFLAIFYGDVPLPYGHWHEDRSGQRPKVAWRQTGPKFWSYGNIGFNCGFACSKRSKLGWNPVGASIIWAMTLREAMTTCQRCLPCCSGLHCFF